MTAHTETGATETEGTGTIAATEADAVDATDAEQDDAGAGPTDAAPRRSLLRRPGGALRRTPAATTTLVGQALPAGRAARTVVIAVLVLLVAAGGTGVGLLTASVLTDHGQEGAARNGLQAATDLTPVLLSYDWRSIDADAARIDAAGTGPFADQNRAIMAGLVKPAAVENQAVSKAGVSATALVSAEPGRAVVLVYFTQTTTMPSLPGPRVDSRSARVTVVKTDDGRWLVSGFDAV